MAEGADHRLHAISTTLEAMRMAFNQNHLAYTNALGAVDGHIAVIRAVVNDIHRGVVTETVEGDVDWDTYYGWYNEHRRQQLADEAAARSAEKAPVVESLPEFIGGEDGGGNR